MTQRKQINALAAERRAKSKPSRASLLEEIDVLRATVKRLDDEQQACFELLKPFHDSIHIEQTLPKFLAETLYPEGGRLVFELIGPSFDWEEAGNCGGLPCEGTH